MKNETSETGLLTASVIFLAIIIALGFGIFQYARNSLNGGIDRLTRTFDTIDAAEFTDYDQQTVTGNKVLSALQVFEGREAAILIGTKALNNTNSADGAGVIAQSKTPEDERASVIEINVSDTDTAFVINYNALIDFKDDGSSDHSEGGNNAEIDATGDGVFEMVDGTWICYKPFVSVNGVVQYYLVKRDYSTTGMTEYISSGSRFTSNLIRDISSTIMGICLVQQ